MSKDEPTPLNASKEGGAAPNQETAKVRSDKALSESERIQELRDRLYSRGDKPERDIRHALPQRPHEPTHQVRSSDIKKEPVVIEKQQPADAPKVSAVQYDSPMTATSRRTSFRKKVLLGGLLFFVTAISLSSIFMFMGKNTISGENISLNVVNGPLTVGGGEELSFQVSVANNNTIPIESATLIIEYPEGTHSATEVNKEISTVRQSLDTIATGEVVNIPLKARIFGEENDEKEIRVSIDYRVKGSNATFKKEAEPYRFKVSTSPVVITFDSVKSISSGQELELKLTVQSNSPTPIADLLVKMSYPDGFDFTDTSPETVSGEDTWKIATLKPKEKKVITVKGLMTGYEDESRKFTATAGVANASDRNTLASLLAKAETEVLIEKSFLSVNVLINDDDNETVVMSGTEIARVEIIYTNALDTAIYDGEVLVELSGNALNEFSVNSNEGFYNSAKNTIRWDGTEVDSLKEILPGKSSRLSFSIDPKDSVGKAPEMNIKVTVRGVRLFENQPSQELGGIAERSIKIESVHSLESFVLHESGPFTNTGPTPPVAEEVTQYTYKLTVKTGSNDVTNAEVTAVIPQYVNWLDLVTDGDQVTYNRSTRVMKWLIGDMEANSTEEVAMQISFKPSISQIESTPTLLEAQRFKATDRFTGTVVRAEHPALTTSIPAEEAADGRVRAGS